MARIWLPRDAVSIHLDREPIMAQRGEPVAAALIAADRFAVARSPKFHRPRGPSCFRAACDGCLARVDGVPNEMTCRLPAEDGMQIETQNVVGTRKTDLLRAADWMFPHGLNHHELLAGVPGVQRGLQVFARRVAGLGKLPDVHGAPSPAPVTRRHADVLVVGAGAAGMAASLHLAERGRNIEVVDDDLTWGGSLRALAGAAAEPWARLQSAFADAILRGAVTVRGRTTAAAIYGDDVLIASNDGVEVVVARTLVLAPGAHDGVAVFEGNDVPGVMSARAAGWLLERGVLVGKRVAVAIDAGAGPFGEAYARAVQGAVAIHGVPTHVRGGVRVKEAAFATAAGSRRLECDAVLVDAPRAPAYELCAQAGATLVHEPWGFVVRVAADRRVRDGVFAVGEAVGTPLEPDAILREAATVAG